MRIVVQRSLQAEVLVNQEITGKIEHGLVLLVGITHEDSIEDVKYTADKIANLRIFEDENEKLNRSILDTKGSILSISQFTLYGETKKGRRPNFMAAARGDHAEPLYEAFNEYLKTTYGLQVETGVFGANMKVTLTNDGPVTIIVES